VGARTRVQFDLAGPKLRTGSIEPAPARARWSPHEESSVVFLLEGAEKPDDGPSSGLFVPLAAGDAAAALLSAARVGDMLRLEDARGRNRELRVTDIGTGRSSWLSAACDKKGMLAPGLRVEMLRREVAEPAAAGDKHSSRRKKEPKKGDGLKTLAAAAVGALPLQPGFLLLRTGAFSLR
jgi:pyruvate kinase